MKPSEKCGHVFILNCSADGLATDAVLINSETANDKEVFLDESDTSKVRVYKGNLEGSKNIKKELDICESYLQQAVEHFDGKWSSFRRAKVLLSLTLSGKHDASKRDDLIVKAYEIADKNGVDIALCVPDADGYIATIKLRQEHCPIEGGPFWMLNESQLKEIERLASIQKAGRLSVFIGAGISIPSGAPSWGGLLEMLAVEAGMNEEDRKHLKDLGFLDQPTILEEDMGDKFKPTVAKCISSSARYTPAHSILASLKSQAVTTNYDRLYESAAESAGSTIHPLPWDATKMIQGRFEDKTALLKLHGCVHHPESIVLTRGDYMRYPDEKQALRGRLHGMFLTSEMLFCGFSMTDDNVHKIIDDIRKVRYEDGQPLKDGVFGTILTMTYNKMFDRLWDQDFHISSFGKSWADDPAWFHDAFLDCLSASCTE